MFFVKFKSIIYKFIKKVEFKIVYHKFLKQKSPNQGINNLKRNPISNIDIVTIAFNNPVAIDYQIRLIKKYVNDDYTHIIADNSTDFKSIQEISSLCDRYNILYVKIPYIKLKPSWSHAAALHWTFINIIKKRNSEYFGFLDHDIFPITSTKITAKFWNGIYGRVIPAYGANEVSDKQPYWSLWGGFAFFKSDLFKNINSFKFNFLPKVISPNLILDTGGGLWDLVLSKIPIPPQLVKYEEKKINHHNYRNIQSDAYEQIDGWIHCVNLSNWFGTQGIENKTNYLFDILNSHLNHE
jgi:hypothetical protein